MDLQILTISTIQIITTERSICGYALSFNLKVINYNIQLLESEMIDGIITTVKKYKNKILKPYDFRLFLEQFPESLRFSFLRNVLLRIKDYYYTFEEMTRTIVKQIEILPIRSDDELILVVLNQLSSKSPEFWTYLTQHYLDSSLSKKQRKMKASNVPKFLAKYSQSNRVFIVFIDDVIGSGYQFIKYYKSDFELKYRKKSIEPNKKIKFYLVAGIGSEKSIDYISKNSLLKESHIRYSKIIRKDEKAFDPKNWDDIDQLNRVKEFLKKIHPKRWSGYTVSDQETGLEYLVVLKWNTPNNTIGCLYKNTKDWKSLFPRTKN